MHEPLGRINLGATVSNEIKVDLVAVDGERLEAHEREARQSENEPAQGPEHEGGRREETGARDKEREEPEEVEAPSGAIEVARHTLPGIATRDLLLERVGGGEGDVPPLSAVDVLLVLNTAAAQNRVKPAVDVLGHVQRF